MDINEKIGQGISTVEFLYSPNVDRLWFVEAKSSSPQQKANEERFNDFIKEIVAKFTQSFGVYQASRCGRYGKTILGEKLMDQDRSMLEVKFILVINGHRADWLPPIREALLKEMIVHNKIWKSTIIVWNDQMAMKRKLVSSYSM